MDHDGFGDGTATPVCGQPTTTLVANNTDCCDTDNRAHPQGAPASPADYPGLTTLEDGGVGPQVADNCGSFDYDCSGSAVELYANLCTKANYECPGTSCSLTVLSSCAGICTGSLPLPSQCPIVADPLDGFDLQPACGETANFLDVVCQTNGSPSVCSGATTEVTPLFIYQLCL
jgi:hypothetical protein